MFSEMAGCPFTRVAGAVLEGAAHRRDVAQRDHGVVLDPHRQVEHVPGFLDDARHLDRKAPLAGIQAARGNEPVVADNGVDQLVVGYPVGFKGIGIDDRFEHFFAVSLQLGIEYLR